MNDLSNRFIEFYNYLLSQNIVSSAKEFAQNIEVSGSLITEITKGRSIVGTKAIQNSVLVYGLNTEWLFTGVGSILKIQDSTDNFNISEPYSSYNLKTCEIPIMDIQVAAGITGFINSGHFDTFDKIILPRKMVKGSTHVCVRAKGESMSPTILDSDNIIVRLLDKSEWAEMYDEHIYVVVDREGKSYLKRIKNRLSSGFIVCMSDNIDKSNYPNFNIQADEIQNLWHAEWHISAKMPNINETYYNRVKAVEDSIDTIFNRLKSLET